MVDILARPEIPVADEPIFWDYFISDTLMHSTLVFYPNQRRNNNWNRQQIHFYLIPESVHFLLIALLVRIDVLPFQRVFYIQKIAFNRISGN